MKKIFLVLSLLACSQLNAYEKMPSDRELVAQAIKPFSILGISLGVVGLAYSGFLYYNMLTTTHPKGRAICKELGDFAFKVGSISTAAGAGLYVLTKHLEK